MSTLNERYKYTYLAKKKFEEGYWRWRRILYNICIHHQIIYLMHNPGLSLAQNVAGVVPSFRIKNPIIELHFRQVFS